MTRIKAFVFDVYGTLFDVYSVKQKCNQFFPGKSDAIILTWRSKQLEYSFLRHMMGSYESFWIITRDALRYAVSEQNESLSQEAERELMNAYLHLTPYPEVAEVLGHIEHQTAAVFSNGSHDMLDPLIHNAGLRPFFQHLISIDEIKQYKPAPAAYNLILRTLGVRREEVLFFSSNGWDISGAKNFGFHTAWINRSLLPIEELHMPPDKVYTDLTGLLEWTW